MPNFGEGLLGFEGANFRHVGLELVLEGHAIVLQEAVGHYEGGRREDEERGREGEEGVPISGHSLALSLSTGYSCNT